MKLRAPFQKVLSEGIDVYQSQTDDKVIPSYKLNFRNEIAYG